MPSGILMKIRELFRRIAVGLRVHRRRPILSVVVILSLVLGVGVGTAVVSLLDALFLRPLPVEDLDRLLAVYRTTRTEAGEYTGMGRFSHATCADLRDRSRTLDETGIYTWGSVNFSADGRESVRAIVMFADAGYFRTLGIRPAQGRFFRSEETDPRSAAQVAVLSHATWTSHFGSDPGVVGRTVRINSLPYTVVGVGPPGFRGTQLHVEVDVWVPAPSYRELGLIGEYFDDRDVSIFSMIGRMAPGASSDEAQQDLMALARRLEEEHPAEEEGLGVTVEPLLDGVLLPRERPEFVGYAKVLSLSAGLVLLVSCLNVVVLLLLRTLERTRELAVRQVLGARRGRLALQIGGENLLLFALGGMLAIPAAEWALDLLWKFRPPRFSGGILESGLDDSRLLWSLGLLGLVTLLFGVLPAWWSTRIDPGRQIQAGGLTRGAGGRFRAGDLLVAGQVGLAVVALVGGGLFVRHLQEARSTDLGFEPERLAVMTVAPGDEGYGDEQIVEFYDRLEERVRALPGVEAAAWSANRLLRGSVVQYQIFLPGSDQPAVGGERRYHRTNAIRPGFFETVGISLLQGRDFDTTDRAEGPSVAIINRTMAETAWPGEDAVGKHFHFSYPTDPPVEVVGVVEDARYRYIDEDPQFFVYVPFAQALPGAATLHVRTEGAPERLLGTLRDLSLDLDSSIPVADLAPMSSFVDEGLWLERTAATFLVAMSLLAVLLLVIGVHAVTSFWVGRRTREIGIRLSLGADRGRVRREILAGVGWRIGAGLVLGVLGVVLALRPAAASFLGGVEPLPTSVLGVAAAAAIGVAALAATLRPVRRAGRVDPTTLLREE